jgi:hypothetical protein
MAYKYKLAKPIEEDKLGSAQDLSNVGLTPEEFDFLGQNVDFEARKKYVTTPANTPKSQELKNIIYYSLEDAGFDLDQIRKYMKFLNIERSRNVGGKGGNTPLNELTPKVGFATPKQDPFKTAMEKIQKKVEDQLRKSGYSLPNIEKIKNIFKSKELKEMVMTKLKEGKPCWKGYEQIGMKEKDGRQVPNCVPKKR